MHQGEAAPIDDDVHRAFLAHDKDRSGAIDVSELRVALASLGLPADTAQTVAVMSRYDADRSGTIDLQEFRTLVAEVQAYLRQSGSGSVARAVRAAQPTTGSSTWWSEVPRVFREFDRDQNGSMDLRELRDALGDLGR